MYISNILLYCIVKYMTFLKLRFVQFVSWRAIENNILFIKINKYLFTCIKFIWEQTTTFHEFVMH